MNMTKKSNQHNWERVLTGLSAQTVQNYRQAVGLYEECHNKSMDEMVAEALEEQTKRVAEHLLSIYDRIIDYRNFLVEMGRVSSGIKKYVGIIKTIYKKCRVRIPYIPPLNEISAKHNEVIKFEDYLTKAEIRQGIQYLPMIQQARCLAMVTGGLTNDECASLKTKEHFIDPLYPYHQCDDDIDALKWLAESDNVLWIICIKRGKTGKPFYAIMNPECVSLTARAKLGEITLSDFQRKSNPNRSIDPKLYPTSKNYFGLCCRRINRQLGFGKAGGKTRFRPHMFRKFHSTAVRGNYHIADVGLTPSEIDELQGRGMTSVQSTYIKSNPKKQKFLYAQIINQVSLWHKYGYKVVDDDVELFVVDDAEKSKKLEKENKKLKEQLEISQDIRSDVKDLISDKGIDEVVDIVAELLKAT